MKAVCKNFQAISSAKLEGEGFLVITGRSDIGKSSFIRALAGCFFGWPGDFYVKDGTPQCGVAFQDTDIDLRWLKVKTGQNTPTRNTSLQINSNLHTKVGKDHAKLTEPLGFRELETSTIRVRPQIALQHDNIFMLAENATTNAEVMKMVGRVDVVTSAQRKAKKDLGSTNERLKIRKEDLDSALRAYKATSYVTNLRIGLDKLSVGVENSIQNSLLKEELLSKMKRYGQLTSVEVPIAPELPSIPEAVKLVGTILSLRKLASVEVPIAPPPPQIPGLKNKLDQMATYIIVSKEHENLQGECTCNDNELLQLSHDKKNMEQELGVCPLCSRDFEHDHA